MKSGELIEYNQKNFFLQKLYRKWSRETSSRPLYFCESLIWGESKWFAAYFWYILIALNLPYNKSKLCKTLDYWFRDMLIFNFSEKCWKLVSPLHFVNDFPKRMFLMLHSINWPNFIVWLPLLLNIIKFEIYLIFLIKLCLIHGQNVKTKT